MENLQRSQAPSLLSCALIVLALAQVVALDVRIAKRADAAADRAHSDAEEVVSPPHDHPVEQFTAEDVLWLARCIYSETKRADEQELVAWVVRNRVDTRYRKKSTYRDVVLEPFQFSAFNPENPKRDFYLGLNERSGGKAWHRALEVAHAVLSADPCDRPFSEKTRHFYSPCSMEDGRTPLWAGEMEPLEVGGVDPERFRFFAYVV